MENRQQQKVNTIVIIKKKKDGLPLWRRALKCIDFYLYIYLWRGRRCKEFFLWGMNSIEDNNDMTNYSKTSNHTCMPNISLIHVHTTLPCMATFDTSFYVHRANFSPAFKGPSQALKLQWQPNEGLHEKV